MYFYLDSLLKIQSCDYITDEPINSHHPRKPLDDQCAINAHLMHEPLLMDEHASMTIGRIFKAHH